MNPTIWGKHAWNFMHLVTMGYPEYPTEEDKQHYYDYLSQLRYVLPCGKCRVGYNDHLKYIPLNEQALSSRSELIRWSINMHNAVNRATGKPELSYPQALKYLDQLSQPTMRGGSSLGKNSNYIYLALITIALVISAILIFFILQK